MRWRKFFSDAASLFRQEPKVKSPDGLTEKYADAMTLVARLLNGDPVSRRIMERQRMSQGRYEGACDLLVAQHLIVVFPGQAPRLAWGVNDVDGVDKVLSEWIDEQRRLARLNRRFIPPLSPGSL